MSARYYRVTIDPSGGYWFLSDPRAVDGSEIDPRLFWKGERYEGSPLSHASIGSAVREVPFNFGSFDMPIVQAALGDALKALAGHEIELLPITIAGSRDRYAVLNALTWVQAFDLETSSYTRWTQDDGRPDKVGQLRMVVELRLDPKRVGGRQIFRLKEWPIALIVSERIRNLLVEIGDSGVRCEPVSG